MGSGLEFLYRLFGGSISPADFGEGADGDVWFFILKMIGMRKFRRSFPACGRKSLLMEEC